MRALHLSIVLLCLTALTAATAEDVYFKAADGKWRPLPCQVDAARGVISFRLDPAQIKHGTTTVVLSRQQGIVLDDELAPRVTGIKLDGVGVKVTPVANLDWLAAHPREIIIGISDAANPLDLASLRAQINGRQLALSEYRVEPANGGRSVRLVLPVAELAREQGLVTNTIDLRLADLSPQQNTLSQRLVYQQLGEVTKSPTLVTDTCHEGYTDLGVVVDGKVTQPGETTYGSTWASAEQPGDHWLVMAWPTPKHLQKVEVFWATFSGVFHAPQELLVQTWDGKQWVTRERLTNLKAEASTVIPLFPTPTTRLRLLQPDAKGNNARPNIMWITEIKVEDLGDVTK